MNRTAINWTELTWNPASGCEKVSAGCKHCYADALAEQKRGTRAFPDGFDLTLREHKLAEPGRVKRPSLIFTSSMTDVFFLPEGYRERVLEVMRCTPQHRYQLLTKRADVAAAWLRDHPLPSNVWLGVTAEHEETARARLDSLRSIDVPSGVRFISAEPLLGEITSPLDGIAWVIAGGESGLHLSRSADELERRGLVRRDARTWTPRQDRAPWVRGLRDECERVGAAFWFKQWGGPTPKSGGRILDGRGHSAMPSHVEGAMPAEYVHGERGAKRQLSLVAQSSE